MRVHCLTTGAVRPKEHPRGVRRWLPGGWAEHTLPVHAFAVEHEAGVCLFDTGQEAAAGRRGYFPRWHPFFWLSRFELGAEDEAAPQLAALGIAPERVRWVVFSHLHTDHVGGLGPFARSDVVVSRVEWEQSQGLGGRLRGYLPQRWPRGLVPRLVELDGPGIGPFAGSHDLAGDARLVLVAAPGHTAGHLCLVARDGERGFLLGGDFAHTRDELPPEVADFCRQSGLVYLGAHDPAAPELVAP